MTELIIAFLALQANPISYSTLKAHFGTTVESTLVRNLNRLVAAKKIKKTSSGKSTFYEIIRGNKKIYDYFSKQFFERNIVGYNTDFLASYIPNHSSFLGSYAKTLGEKTKGLQKLQTIDYMGNIRGIENMLIDLSYSSSKLEGNTYSYLETEVLIKANEKALGKTREETQMILNHKEVINYIITNRSHLELNKRVFFDVHTLLGKDLLRDADLGCIRKIHVQIGGSTYTPLDNHYQLNEEVALFFEKLCQIKNPFEQSLFIMVFIPYFQMFLDINKRTSRISANIPLLHHGLPIISLLQVPEQDYITAILAVYELNDPSLMAELYTNNYLLNMSRYLPPR